MKVTLEDIAQKVNVSRMTVSRVFSGTSRVSKETEQKIRLAAEEMGYHPNLIARSLSIRRSMTIGIFMPKMKDAFHDIYISQIFSGISDVIQDFDYRIMVFPFEYDDKQKDLYFSIAKSHLVDGIILLKTRVDDGGLEKLADMNFPFVLVNHKKYAGKFNFVDSRNIEGARQAVEYLYKLGHRKIAFVAGTMNESNGIDRFDGYCQAMQQLELPYNEEWVVNGDFCKEKAYEACGSLLKQTTRPTAIFCADDYMAIGVMECIKDAGLRVPEDISIIGFDDIELSSYIRPALTTIRQPIYEIGKISALMLFELINKEKAAPLNSLLDVELIIRESTARVKE